MKKLLILAIMGLFLVSCGGGPNACDCLKDAEDLAKKITDAKDADEIKSLEKEAKELADECSKAAEEAGSSWVESLKDCK
tara:strand:- start:324 stop:563 length:240 start_codon:yes stop_codon:yes gene_type:complete